jgi:uncharacterized protein YktB (UPF0637 family)
MYDDIKDELFKLIDMQKQPDKYSDVAILQQRVRILELLVGSLISREQTALKNQQRVFSTLDLDLSKLLDIMKFKTS